MYLHVLLCILCYWTDSWDFIDNRRGSAHIKCFMDISQVRWPFRSLLIRRYRYEVFWTKTCHLYLVYHASNSNRNVSHERCPPKNLDSAYDSVDDGTQSSTNNFYKSNRPDGMGSHFLFCNSATFKFTERAYSFKVCKHYLPVSSDLFFAFNTVHLSVWQESCTWPSFKFLYGSFLAKVAFDRWITNISSSDNIRVDATIKCSLSLLVNAN